MLVHSFTPRDSVWPLSASSANSTNVIHNCSFKRLPKVIVSTDFMIMKENKAKLSVRKCRATTSLSSPVVPKMYNKTRKMVKNVFAQDLKSPVVCFANNIAPLNYGLLLATGVANFSNSYMVKAHCMNDWLKSWINKKLKGTNGVFVSKTLNILNNISTDVLSICISKSIVVMATKQRILPNSFSWLHQSDYLEDAISLN
ncbi:hypothetical protein EGR_01820 [Echinococcus granulosus]|uniref:Uncharacterized protein n=1 Tax=Echinococcus granulosus TaxID=6210 RepID=W6V9K7_ECHGR|nr:hypothetical protein EGR_01820 [Echinococcus granulosus]EUB63329.1 hypothetical protein EGR_01820 [Echinococcus granulosus]